MPNHLILRRHHTSRIKIFQEITRSCNGQNKMTENEQVVITMVKLSNGEFTTANLRKLNKLQENT